jgi:hypothetical protein
VLTVDYFLLYLVAITANSRHDWLLGSWAKAKECLVFHSVMTVVWAFGEKIIGGSFLASAWYGMLFSVIWVLPFVGSQIWAMVNFLRVSAHSVLLAACSSKTKSKQPGILKDAHHNSSSLASSGQVSDTSGLDYL